MHDVSLTSASAGRCQRCTNLQEAKANLSPRRPRRYYFVATPTSASVIERRLELPRTLHLPSLEVTGQKKTSGTKRHDSPRTSHQVYARPYFLLKYGSTCSPMSSITLSCL